MIDSPPADLRKRPQDGFSWVQRVAAVEIGFCGAPGCFHGIRVYIGERSRSVELRGAHEGGGAPTPLGAPSCPVAASLHLRLNLQVFWFAFGPRKIIAKVSFCLDSVWYSFSGKLKNRQKKQKLALGLG